MSDLIESKLCIISWTSLEMVRKSELSNDQLKKIWPLLRHSNCYVILEVLDVINGLDMDMDIIRDDVALIIAEILKMLSRHMLDVNILGTSLAIIKKCWKIDNNLLLRQRE